MQIIPAINCKNFLCVKTRLQKAAKFLPKSGWVQIDISDGKFTKAKTWNEPKELRELKIKNKELKGIKFEIHLMAEDWKKEIKKWEKSTDRIIIHIEAINNLQPTTYDLRPEFGIAIKPETPIKELFPYFKKGNIRVNPRLPRQRRGQFRAVPRLVQLLAVVNPGYSGQQFNRLTVNKIKFLKKNFPKLKIEIDGGINPQTAKLVKKAGADIIVSGSYIFDSKNPQAAYKKLTQV